MVFISSHILSHLAELCDSVTILDRGEVKYTVTIRGLMVGEKSGAAFALTLAAEHAPLTAALTVGCYIFFAALVAYLSLSMSRAPFASGVCVMFLIRMLLMVWMSGLRGSGNGVAEMLAISVLLWIGIFAIASRIPGRIAAATAAD